MRTEFSGSFVTRVVLIGIVGGLALLRGLVFMLQQEKVRATSQPTVVQESVADSATPARRETAAAPRPPSIPKAPDPGGKRETVVKPRPAETARIRDAGEPSPPEDQLAQTVARLNAVHEREPADPAWAAKAQIRINEYFANTIEAPADVVASCRSTLCRITLQFADDVGRDAAVGTFSLPWDGEGVFRADSNNPLKVVMYAAREGHTLPGD